MSAGKLTAVPAEKTVNLRGTIYRFRELSIGEYDELVKKATTVKPNLMTGEDMDVTDRTLLLRFMLLKCCLEPRLTQAALDTMPMPVVLKLNDIVNVMHYGDEPEIKIVDDDNTPIDEKTEGEPGGNG